MLPYLHILIRVEDDGSLRALGAFTSKEKQLAYQEATELPPDQVRLDFHNGPFDEDIKVIYAGHRRWNMDRFQLADYFINENDAWDWVTQEGYVSVLKIDTTYEAEQALEAEALATYAALQQRWRLSSYKDLIAREGTDKARANIVLRFYEDALQSFSPQTRRDQRALYALSALAFAFPLAILALLSGGPDYGENLPSVDWLPDTTSDISFYRSEQIQVYEFSISPEDFVEWAKAQELTLNEQPSTKTCSRYKAYMSSELAHKEPPQLPEQPITIETFNDWQETISITITDALIAQSDGTALAIYDPSTHRAYYQHLAHK